MTERPFYYTWKWLQEQDIETLRDRASRYASEFNHSHEAIKDGARAPKVSSMTREQLIDYIWENCEKRPKVIPLEAECPTCEAAPGEPCESSANGWKPGDLHATRTGAAKRDRAIREIQEDPSAVMLGNDDQTTGWLKWFFEVEGAARHDLRVVR
jgi:hypothetical protein